MKGSSKNNTRTNKLFYTMIGFVPRHLLSTLLTDQRARIYERFDAALLFADISGFTALSEKIATMGKEGSEEVTKIINQFFEPLIDVINKWGGDIYRFGGDAILSFFPCGERRLSAAARAVGAAREAIAFVKEHKTTKTQVGAFKINMHIGITKGTVFYKDLKSDFFMAGKITNTLMKIADKASAGEIIVDTATKRNAEGFRFKPLQRSIWKYCGLTKRIRPISSPKKTVVGAGIPEHVICQKLESLKAYVPDWLYKRIEMKPSFDQRDGEHRRATVLFLHFSGIPYEQDPHMTAIMLRDFYSILKHELGNYGGWLNKVDVYTDSARVLVVFGFPRTYGDDEMRAVLFADEIINTTVFKEMELRMGIHSGLIFAAPVGSAFRREYTVMGSAVNLAARLAAKADDNSIRVSEVVFNKTFAQFEYELLGRKTYKGKKEAVLSYRLLRKRRVERTTLARWITESHKIVGRKKELTKLKGIAELARKAKGQVVGIRGEAGMGKSRLTQEFMKLVKDAGFHTLLGDCVSYGKALSYHPFIDILLIFFGIAPSDSLAVRKKKIKNKIRSLDKKLVSWLPVIGEVLGVPFPGTKLTKFLDAKIKKQKFFDIVFDFVKRMARRKPLCLIIDDMHWIDSVSMELVNYIARNIQNKKILILLVFRPIESPEEFMGKDYYAEITVKELNKNEAAQLAGNLLNIRALPDDFKKTVITQSQGNPFYIEEIVKSFIEQGVVCEDRKGKWKFAGDIKHIELPDTVEGIILTRIDRLDITEKDVLQTASVLGREFDGFLITAIYPDKKLLRRALDNLGKFDLIRFEKARGKVKYLFKHILTQEVTYGTLSFVRKRELHRDIGIFIEEKLKDRRGEFLGLLSHHFYQGKNYDKALLYSVEAGEKAKKVYANEEAIEFFTRAIESYEKLESGQV